MLLGELGDGIVTAGTVDPLTSQLHTIPVVSYVDGAAPTPDIIAGLDDLNIIYSRIHQGPGGADPRPASTDNNDVQNTVIAGLL